MRNDHISPSMRLRPTAEKAVLKLLAWIAVLCVLLMYWNDSKARTAVFQAKESTATVSHPSKCPGKKPDATMSVSTWNSGGWPLFRITCYWRGK